MNSGSNPNSMKSCVLNELEEFVVHHSNRFGAESDLSFDPARNLFFQALECPANDK